MIAATLASVIERRILINYRVDPDIAAALLPPSLEPQIQHGWAVGGICLIRLGHTRPRWAPTRLGLRSENAAHRIAVRWHGSGGEQTGVYIPRRDSGSWANVIGGGRVFPGHHGSARFDVQETAREMRVSYAGRDGVAYVDASVTVAEKFAGTELFPDLPAASEFFRTSPQGFSPRRTRTDGGLEGVELSSADWHVEPLTIDSVRSSYFDDVARFPAGSAVLDSALLMRDLPVSWHALTNEPLAA